MISRKPISLAREAFWYSIRAYRRHLSRRLPRGFKERRHAAQVYHGHREREHLLRPLLASYLQLPKSPVLLGVSEDRFDQLANDLADRVPGMSGGALIDGAAAVGGVLGHMGRDGDGATDQYPLIDARGVRKHLGVSLDTAITWLQKFEEMKIVREITGQKRGRVYRFDRYMDALDAGWTDRKNAKSNEAVRLPAKVPSA